MDIIDRIVYDLSTIANVSKGEKINTSKEYMCVEGKSLVPGIWRTFSGDSREKTARDIDFRVKTACKFLELLLDSVHVQGHKKNSEKRKEITQIINLYNALNRAVRGIKNLCSTYKTDADFIGHLVPLLREIDEIETKIISSGIMSNGSSSVSGDINGT